jgi:hypothetical protein
VVANNSQQSWKYGRYLYILAITNKKIRFKRTLELWSETFMARKIPINKLNGKWTFNQKVDEGFRSATMTQRVNLHYKGHQTISGGKNTMRNQPLLRTANDVLIVHKRPLQSKSSRHHRLIKWRENVHNVFDQGMRA